MPSDKRFINELPDFAKLNCHGASEDILGTKLKVSHYSNVLKTKPWAGWVCWSECKWVSVYKASWNSGNPNWRTKKSGLDRVEAVGNVPIFPGCFLY